MKAIRATIPRNYLGACVALSALLAGCVSPVQAPSPAPLPPRPLPQPAPVPQAASTDWHDMAATPGEWQWRREGGLSVARFGDPQATALFAMNCDPQAGTITMSRAGPVAPAANMVIRTTSLSRAVAIRQTAAGAVAAMAAHDPLLDAMAFSRGRFAVEVPGLAPLYLPSWPEVSRVIEDCR